MRCFEETQALVGHVTLPSTAALTLLNASSLSAVAHDSQHYT